MKQEKVSELLYEALETEMGGVEVYTAAVACAINEDLKEEWQEYLEQTQKHVQRMREVLESMGLDPERETPGRKVVRHIGRSLVKAMEMARKEGEPEAAELVAGECIVLAESKDHLNWELMSEISKNGNRQELSVMRRACEEIEEEEDEHLYHTMGWTRELWMKSLGLKAVIPPPEEKKDVKSMMEAAQAKESRGAGRSRTTRRPAAAAKSSKRARSASASNRKSASRKSTRKKTSSRR